MKICGRGKVRDCPERSSNTCLSAARRPVRILWANRYQRVLSSPVLRPSATRIGQGNSEGGGGPDTRVGPETNCSSQHSINRPSYGPINSRSMRIPAAPDPMERSGPLAESPRFVDVTASSGIDFRHVHGGTGRKYFVETMGAGVAFLDYNSDGRLDVFAVNGGTLPGYAGPPPRNRLYRNAGGGRFSDVTRFAGVGRTAYGMGVCAGDCRQRRARRPLRNLLRAEQPVPEQRRRDVQKRRGRGRRSRRSRVERGVRLPGLRR